MNVHKLICFGMCALLIAAGQIPADDDVPLPDAKPLSEIVKSLEDSGAGQIAELEFDDSMWEVLTYKDNRWTKLFVNPTTGDVSRREWAEAEDDLPPTDAKPLSEILKSVEDQRMGVIRQVEYERGRWDVELRNGGQRVELHIDPKTGATLRTRTH
ncbi:MAG TPA: PepSY domain-containing protein [Anaerohalosphaeraceae bacterium]|jgi:uncharacterized membrane protein YkoI|nr:PepSY domain-containing protein [Anaerohalosphaeraceae bacterium]HRT51235.1 PepSY domain-containing protein [Anaerohalosphaeraceae bacterium]HRT87426.1 PepSY domain-containing protein [Anaerohalosphaeraceae bacterium]